MSIFAIAPPHSSYQSLPLSAPRQLAKHASWVVTFGQLQTPVTVDAVHLSGSQSNRISPQMNRAYQFVNEVHQWDVQSPTSHVPVTSHLFGVLSLVHRYAPVETLSVPAGQSPLMHTRIEKVDVRTTPHALTQKAWLEFLSHQPQADRPKNQLARYYYDPYNPHLMPVLWEDVQIAALLHDVVRLHPQKEDKLLREFGPVVHMLVKSSMDKSLPNRSVSKSTQLIQGADALQSMYAELYEMQENPQKFWGRSLRFPDEKLQEWQENVAQFNVSQLSPKNSSFALLWDNLRRAHGALQEKTEEYLAVHGTRNVGTMASAPPLANSQGPRTSKQLNQALIFAHRVHQDDVQGKQSSIPYISHLLGVLSYVQRYAPAHMLYATSGQTTPYNRIFETIDVSKYQFAMPRDKWLERSAKNPHQREYYDIKNPNKMPILWEDIQIAALLHDVIEDKLKKHPEYIEEMLQTFGPVVTMLVQYASTDKSQKGKMTYNQIKKRYIQFVYDEAPISALLIVGCDKLQNMHVSLQELQDDPKGFWNHFKYSKTEKLEYWKDIVEILTQDSHFPLLWHNLSRAYEHLASEANTKFPWIDRLLAIMPQPKPAAT